MTLMDASVIICTHNRAAYLGGTIKAAAAQEFAGGSFEILVIDNNSTDKTRQVVIDCQSTIKDIPVRYEFEARTGLSIARNRGIRTANGRILCFLDDDAIPEPDWLGYLCAAYRTDSKAMCVGGAIIPEYQAALPPWFGREFEAKFTPLIEGMHLCRVTFRAPGYPFGANLSILSTAASLIGLFNPKLGYAGKEIIPCEETEYLLRLEQAGYHILYEPRAKVRHIIPASRLTPEYFRKRCRAQGRGDEIVHTLSDHVFSTLPLCQQVSCLFHCVRRLCWMRRQYKARWASNIIPETKSSFLSECKYLEGLGQVEQQTIELWKSLGSRSIPRPNRR